MCTAVPAPFCLPTKQLKPSGNKKGAGRAPMGCNQQSGAGGTIRVDERALATIDICEMEERDQVEPYYSKPGSTFFTLYIFPLSIF